MRAFLGLAQAHLELRQARAAVLCAHDVDDLPDFGGNTPEPAVLSTAAEVKEAFDKLGLAESELAGFTAADAKDYVAEHNYEAFPAAREMCVRLQCSGPQVLANKNHNIARAESIKPSSL